MDLNIIPVIINGILIGTFALSLLFGFLRGFKKSFNNLVANLLIIVLAITCCGLVANILIKMDISFVTGDSGKTNIVEYVCDQVFSELDVESKNYPITIDFVESIAISMLRLISYYLILIIGLIIIKPIIKLILKNVIPFNKGKTFRFRLIALGISFVSYILIMFFLTAPIFGTLGMVNQVAKEINDEGVTKVSEDDLDFDDFTSGVALNIIKTIFTDEFTLQAEFTGKLLEIKTEYGSINIKNEIDNHSLLVGIVYNNIDNEEVLFQEIVNKHNKVLKGFEDSEILNVSMPVAVEILKTELKDENINFDKLQDAKWSQEKQNIIDILRAVCEFSESVDLDFKKPETMLSSPQLPSALKSIGSSLNKSGIFKDVMLVYINDLVQESIVKENQDLQNLATVLDLTKLDLEKDFETIGYVLNDLYKINIFDSENINVLDNIESVENILTNIFNLSSIKNNEQIILETIIELTEMDKTLSKVGLTINYSNVNWNDEVNNIKSIFTEILTLVKDCGYSDIKDVDIINVLMNKENKQQTISIINKFSNSYLIKDSLVNMISTLMDDMGLSDWKSEKLIAYQESNESHSTWAANEIIKAIDIYDEMETLLDIKLETMGDLKLEELEETLLEVNELEFITLDNFIPMINGVFEESDLEVTLLDKVYDRNNSSEYDSNKDEWNEEISVLLYIVNELNFIDLSYQKIQYAGSSISHILEKMKTSLIFGNDLRHDGDATTDDNIFNAIVLDILMDNDLIKTNSNNGFIDYNDAVNDDWSRYNYDDELDIISSYDTDLGVQNDSVIGQLQSSQIIKKYFDISSIINDKIASVSFEIYGTNYALKDYINGGNPLTNDELYDRNWADEIADVNEIISVFEANDTTEFLEKIYAFAELENDTLAVQAAKEIKQKIIQQLG